MKHRYLRRPKVTANDDGSLYIRAQVAQVFIEPGAELDKLIRDLQRVQRKNADAMACECDGIPAGGPCDRCRGSSI